MSKRVTTSTQVAGVNIGAHTTTGGQTYRHRQPAFGIGTVPHRWIGPLWLGAMHPKLQRTGMATTKYPRRGVAPTVVSLALIGFVLLMVAIFFFLRRSPPAKTHPDKNQSSGIYRMV